ncbi:lipopolysaccharide biosynthesis protein [Methylophaga sulfidovorans]|uniref:Membrane protein involved in the export of O-antigen and teichoic acid n=1 Tax=Methylophaga sulfidovorans TaxID=45496 RepID=A0A1I3XMG0_9GAMM|nr:hypothetical protein [Methylophaga sulfidovorans]SFK20744.1 Membrane protein involved in the export of O-antigen and teichoic acid [Methylophaga sulfidovorans]
MSGIEISKKIILINSLSSAISLLLSMSVLVWLQQYLLKHISASEYSLIPIVLSAMAFAPLMTTVLTGGLSRFVTVAYAKNDLEQINTICSTMFPILFLAGIVFLIVGWWIAWNIDTFLVIAPQYLLDAKIMLALMVFSTAVRLPLTVFLSGFMVRQKLVWQDLIDITCNLFRIALLFCLLFGLSAKALWVTVALVCSELLNLAISTPISLKLLPAQKVSFRKFKKTLAKEITAFGSWWFVGSLADVIKKAMDPLILNRFSTAFEVTVFYVSDLVPRTMIQILMPISKPFFPILAGMVATQDNVRLRNTYTRTARYHTWIVLMIAVPVVCFSTELMHLYLNGQYDKAGGVMAILMGVTIMNALNALGAAVALASGDMRGLSLRVIFIQITNLLLTFLFVVRYEQGAYGSAYASIIAVVILDVTLKWPFCRRLAHTPFIYWFKECLIPTFIPALPALLFCLFVKSEYDIDSWVKLISVSALSAFVYIVFIVKFGLRTQDKMDLMRMSQIDKVPEPMKKVLKLLAKS